MMLLLTFGCSGPKGDDTGELPGFHLFDGNNYSYESSIDGSDTEVQLAHDFSVDWSGLTTDLLGHSLDPATDVDTVWLLQFDSLTEAEVESQIVDESLLQEDLGSYVTFENTTGATSCNLSDFSAGIDTHVVPETDFVDGSGTWFMRVTTGSTNTRMILFLQPTETSENHSVTFSPASADLFFEADLHSLESFAFDAEPTDYSIDWSALTRHANGNELVLATMDQLLVGRYDGMTVSDIEDQFVDIDTIASEIYTADVYGKTDASLTDATNDAGGAFSGFGAGSLWLIALRCTLCTNPAPPFVTVVEVAG